VSWPKSNAKKSYRNPLSFLSPSLLLCGVHLLKKNNTQQRNLSYWSHVDVFNDISHNSTTKPLTPFLCYKGFKRNIIRTSTYLSFFINLPWDCPLCTDRQTDRKGFFITLYQIFFDIKYFTRISKGLQKGFSTG